MFTVKLADFGCAKVLPKTAPRPSIQLISPVSPPNTATHSLSSNNTNHSVANALNLTTITEDSEEMAFQHQISSFIHEFTPNYNTHMENSLALTDYLGSRRYRAPEMLGQSTNYHFEVDIWALGCSLVEFIKNSPLFKGKTEQEVLDNMLNYFTDIPITVQHQLTSHGMKLPITAPMAGKMVEESKKHNLNDTLVPSSTTTTTTVNNMPPQQYVISLNHALIKDNGARQYRSIHNEIHLVKLNLRCILGM